MSTRYFLVFCLARATQQCLRKTTSLSKKSDAVEQNGVKQGPKSLQKKVSGHITDAYDEPIVGASISVKGTKVGAISDIDGNFTLQDVSLGSTLDITYIGFSPKHVVVAGSKIPTVVLQEDDNTLNELVVIGYGTQRKADLTGSVASVDASKLNTQSNTTLGQTLQGKISGVDIVSQGGTPGSGTRVMVRGIGTLNNASPLYIVDGMYMSSIDQINPSDVESIDVLKDASSSAIYGSRAANGVVIITTKSGKDSNGTPIFNATANIGVNAPSKYLDLCNAQQWADISTKARAVAGLEPIEMAIDLNSKEDNDWQDIMFAPALMQNYYLSVQGGNKNVTYYNSFGYTNQDGTMKGTEFQRYTMQSKLDYRKGIFNMGTNILLEYDQDKPIMGGVRGGMIGHTLLSVPTLAKYNPDGSYGYQYGDVVNLFHPLGMVDDSQFRRRRNNAKVYANAYISVEPIKGLKYKFNFSPDFEFYRNSSYQGVYDYGLNKGSKSLTNDNQTRTRNYLLENLLTFDRSFGAHKLSLLAGFTYQDTQYRYLHGEAMEMPDGILEIDAGASGFLSGGNSYHSTLTSLLGRVFYSYDNRYLISATIRRDGSSKFASDHHYSNFPSVSIGWNLSEEKFMKDRLPWLDQLKFRAGYGELGNQEVANYQYSAVVTTSINYPNSEGGVLQGAFPKYFANPDIKWEATSMTNVGIDFMAMNSRLSLTMDYYIKKTRDILLAVPIPPSTGAANNPVRNAGKIQNKGFEFNVGWRDQIGKDWSYSISFLGTFNKNKVLAMGSESQFITGGQVHGGTYTTKTLKGYPIGGFWLIPTEGYFNSEEEVKGYNKNGVLIQPSAEPGDIKFKDVNGDGTINDEDRVYSGSPFPDFTYSVNGSVSYKNFDLSFTLQGVTGNKIYNATRLELSDVTRGTNYLTDVLDYWTPENHYAKSPRMIWTDPNRNARSESDRFLESGTYLRLRTIQIGYNLPANFLHLFKSARVYVNIDNLFTITPYSGYSPDVNASSVYERGFDEFIYPNNRTYMLGVNVTF